MTRKKSDRQALLGALADHVLAHGLNTASLRPMAAAADTSDRMLIYHFSSKSALITELLGFLAARMAAHLDAAVPVARFGTEQLLVREILRQMRSEAFAPYTRVWWDIVSAAALGSETHGKAGHAIIGLFLDWLALRHPLGAAGAARALVLIEGSLLMDAVGHQAIADVAGAALPD